MKRRNSWLAAALLLTLPSTRVFAEAKISIEAQGDAFTDPTPVAPVGGNTGTTLGAQRLIALQHAAKLWGAELDSYAPIAIDVAFRDLGCSAGGATLAHAGPTTAMNGLDKDGADPSLWYAAPIANRLAGEDLWPGQSEIIAEFNSAVDDPSCGVGTWYYGLDGKGGGLNDLVEVALHEFGHGLGFTAFVDSRTGEMIAPNQSDSFSARLIDNQLNQSFRGLSDVQRMAAAARVRGVSWGGPRVTDAAAAHLGRGAPALALFPAVPGFTGWVADAGFSSVLMSVTGPVVIAESLDGCFAPPPGTLTGKVVFYEPRCSPDQVARNARDAGAIGILMAMSSNLDSPARPLPGFSLSVAIPVISLSEADGVLLKQAAAAQSIQATLTLDPARRKGTDDSGRVLMFTSEPLLAGSALSHFDILARPDLLMEPFAGYEAPHQVDLTKALMIDIGWTPFCGNGRIDQQEVCDQGSANSNQIADACRSTCVKARCGDRVIDTGEGCDDGTDNSDVVANACRLSCVSAYCGDRVVDANEGCDLGSANSDVTADGCRSNCRPASCGDGVVDRGETCDGKGCNAQCTGAVASSGADGGVDITSSTENATEGESSKADGCGCRVPGAPRTPSRPAFVLALLGLGIWWRRRSRVRG